jgi:hypothetical protein
VRTTCSPANPTPCGTRLSRVGRNGAGTSDPNQYGNQSVRQAYRATSAADTAPAPRRTAPALPRRDGTDGRTGAPIALPGIRSEVSAIRFSEVLSAEC